MFGNIYLASYRFFIYVRYRLQSVSVIVVMLVRWCQICSREKEKKIHVHVYIHIYVYVGRENEIFLAGVFDKPWASIIIVPCKPV